MDLEIDEGKIDAIFAALNRGDLPGVAVGLAVHGRPVYRKAFGLATLELPILLSPSMRMRIGSTTKHFTSLAYMLLCEAGMAEVDDPIVKYLPELRRNVPPVTVRQLMTHTSGLHDVYDIVYQLSGIEAEVSSAELMEMYGMLESQNSSPGQAWMYNNGGYLILSTIIERISGRQLEEVLCKHIFEPTGMADTLLRRVDTDFVPNSATLHMTKPSGGFEKRHLGCDASGGGAVVSTVDDMLRWLSHMDRPKVGSAETWRAMRTPQRLSNGLCTDYGFGLMFDRYRGIETVSHAGGVLGGNSQMLKVPSAGLDVVVMLNRGDVSAIMLTEKVLDCCLGDLETQPVLEQESEPLLGSYRSSSTGRLLQFSAKQAEQIVAVDGMDMPFCRHEDVLCPSGAWRYQKFEVRHSRRSQTPASVTFSDFGNVDELARLNTDERGDDRVYEGLFVSEESQTKAVIERAADGLQLFYQGRFGSVVYALIPVAPLLFRAKPAKESFLGGIISFSQDQSVFKFSTFRTSRLRFARQVQP